MAQNAKVGIILVNYNGFPFIKDCLDSLGKIDYHNVQVVVVDNASSDGSPEWIAENHAKVKIIRLSDNFGFSRANNEGIKLCITNNCEYVLLLNSDTIVEADFLTKLMVEADPGVMFVPKIYCYPNKELINNKGGTFDYWRGVAIPYFYGKKDSLQSQKVQSVTMDSASAILIPANAFDNIGFLEEGYFLYWEDTDFIFRAVKYGYIIKIVPQAVIYHREGVSVGGRASPLAIYYNNRNRLYFMAKNKKSMVHWLFFLFYYFLGRLAYIAIYLCRGQIRELKALSLGVFDFYRGKMGYLTPEDQRGFR